MPRLIDSDHCPHCGEELPRDEEEPSAVCPSCGGSLQQRYLQTGCFSTAPPVILLVILTIGWLLLS